MDIKNTQTKNDTTLSELENGVAISCTTVLPMQSSMLNKTRMKIKYGTIDEISPGRRQLAIS